MKNPPKQKTDNRSLGLKIDLRRWLLGELGITDARVLDVCAGSGHIWSAMAAHVPIGQWVRADIKPRQPGTLRLTARQAVTALDVAPFNVIDIDPYGEPWDAYLALLPRLRQPVAVFLTRGRVQFTVSSNYVLTACGIPTAWHVPHSVHLAAYLDARVLSETWRYADITHASTVELRNVSYYALGLRPLAGQNGPL
jgi:uncharacterized membrane protein YqaE (UPF0057 family)